MRIAVTGGTDRVGRRVVQLLGEAGYDDVVALSSRTAPYDDPAALRGAFDGVDTLVFVSGDGEAARVVVQHRNVLAAATECAIGHVVLLSGLDVDLASPFCYAFTNADTERLLRESGCPYSIVRAGLYAEFFLDLVRRLNSEGEGTVALPGGDGRVSLVARDDVAACLAALAMREPTNGHHDVTGPQSLPVATIVEAAGYRYAEATPVEFGAALLGHGEEPWWTYAYTSMFAAIAQDRWAGVSPAVHELTGQPAVPLADVLIAAGLLAGRPGGRVP